MLRASTIKTQNIHIIKTEALKYPTAAQNQGHHPEISITSNKIWKTRQFFFLLFDVVELAKSPQPRPEIARDIMFTVGLKVQACIGIRASKYFDRNLVFTRRKRREKRVGRFLYFPPHSSILISSETKTELASHTLDYGQASVDDDVYKV